MATLFPFDGLTTTRFTFNENSSSNAFRHFIIDLPGPKDNDGTEKHYRNEIERLKKTSPDVFAKHRAEWETFRENKEPYIPEDVTVAKKKEKPQYMYMYQHIKS